MIIIVVVDKEGFKWACICEGGSILSCFTETNRYRVSGISSVLIIQLEGADVTRAEVAIHYFP